mgnify:CR=1 FL=1
MKFRAKPLFGKGELEDDFKKEFSDFIDKDGYIVGWYVDGAIVGKFFDFDEEYISLEFWCKVDVETLEVIE